MMVHCLLFLVLSLGLGSFHSTAAKCSNVIDIGILIDSSASMGDEWLVSAKAFAIQLTENFTIGYEDTRFGMISFSDEAKTEFSFADYSTTGEVELAVGKVDFQNASTRIDKAIHLAQTELFSVGSGTRLHAARFLLVATDGRFSDDLPNFDSLVLPILKQKIEVFVIGIGDEVIAKDLRALALNKLENVFESPSDFNRDKLVSRIRQITAAKCAAPR